MDDFQEYKKLAEPSARKKLENWRVAIGLQQVDDLTPSEYLFEVAKKNIEGKISVDEAEKQITTYYKKNPPKTTTQKAKKEADEVSSRINKLLGKNSFTFSPAEFISIHKYLFTGLLDGVTAGKIRKYDISKDEAILNGDTVNYGRADSIREMLNYDFETEKAFKYSGLDKQEKVKHITKFTSDIWQVHPFGEGNTRTTAVFIIKYLRTLGFSANNDLFEKNSKYFRNALVRANYQNLEKDVYYTMEYLNRFFGNLLLGEKNTLDNRDMQIGIVGESSKKSIKKGSKKSIEKILEVIKQNPAVTLQEMADSVGLSVAGVRKNLDKLRKSKTLKRVGPDKGGHWEVMEDKGRIK
jgi:fido (protein-threonine AMPylation protein)